MPWRKIDRGGGAYLKIMSDLPDVVQVQVLENLYLSVVIGLVLVGELRRSGNGPPRGLGIFPETQTSPSVLETESPQRRKTRIHSLTRLLRSSQLPANRLETPKILSLSPICMRIYFPVTFLFAKTNSNEFGFDTRSREFRISIRAGYIFDTI